MLKVVGLIVLNAELGFGSHGRFECPVVYVSFMCSIRGLIGVLIHSHEIILLLHLFAINIFRAQLTQWYVNFLSNDQASYSLTLSSGTWTKLPCQYETAASLENSLRTHGMSLLLPTCLVWVYL